MQPFIAKECEYCFDKGTNFKVATNNNSWNKNDAEGKKLYDRAIVTCSAP